MRNGTMVVTSALAKERRRMHSFSCEYFLLTGRSKCQDEVDERSRLPGQTARLFHQLPRYLITTRLAFLFKCCPNERPVDSAEGKGHYNSRYNSCLHAVRKDFPPVALEGVI